MKAPGLTILVLLFLSLPFLPGEGPRPAPAASHAPAFDHIFVILEENMDSSQIVGNPAALFINDVLIKQNFSYTNYFALAHGSLPDYLGLVSGAEHRDVIGDPPSDCTPGWNRRRPDCAVMSGWPSNIADSLESSGRSWRAYLQTMGEPCRWQSADPMYDVIHNPFVYFSTVEGGGPVSSDRCVQHDVDLNRDPHHSLAADLASAATTPNLVFIAPDNAHNMHDGNVSGPDRYLRDLFTGSNASGANGGYPVDIFDSPAWKTQRSIAYVVWDEDSGTFRNQVAAIAIGNWVSGPDGRDGTAFSHYAMLRTWETAFGLHPIGPGDAAAGPMLSAFSLLADQGSWRGGRRIELPRAYPEVFARLEVKITSNDSRMPQLSMQGANGVEGCRSAGVDPPQRLSLGWHRIDLHRRAGGDGAICEVAVDGRLLSGVSALPAYGAGGADVDAVVIDGAAGEEFRNLTIATSPI